MTKLRHLIIVMAGLALLAGCGGAGNSSVKNLTEEEVEGQIQKGVTTRSQIQELYGDPAETSFTDNGLVVWEYAYTTQSALTAETIGSTIFTFGLAGGKSKGNSIQLMILFDENDVVQNFSLTDSDISAGSGLFK